ncbi:hypothetical protein GCM10027168_26750 [Streptomyces capparidis]
MRYRLLSILSALAFVMTGSVLTMTPATAAVTHCDGHGTHPDRYASSGVSFGNGTQIRSHPHIGCASVGQGFPGHGIDVHCAIVNSTLWMYVRNTTTGASGWSRVDALRYSRVIEIRDCSSSSVWVVRPDDGAGA